MKVSLQTRLVLGIVCLMAVGLAAADVAGVLLLRSYLLQRVDQQLTRPIGGPPGGGPGPGLPFEPCSAPMPPGNQQLPSRFAILVLDRSGAVRCQLPREPANSPRPDLGSLGAPGLAAAAADGEPQTVPGTAAGTHWRIRVSATADEFTVVAVSLAEADATLNRLALVAAGVGVVILALTAAGGMVLVRTGLKPLVKIEETAGAIAGGDLSRRVEVGPDNTEVGRLAASLNAMLTQIEGAFDDRTASQERLREFVADASHELRTPLATIRGHAELYRHGMANTPEDVGRLLSRIESESLRMGALVEDLLLLARMDAAPTLDLTTVDLLSVAADAVMDAKAQDPARPVVLRPMSGEGWLDAAPVVRADEARVRQILGNLLSNALRHTPPGSPVEVEVGVRNQVARIQVVDHGAGLPAETAERVFERFYRGDPGRARSRGGAGLGLSIVQSLVEAHHGSVRHQPTPGGGSTFTVDLPTPAAS